VVRLTYKIGLQLAKVADQVNGRVKVDAERTSFYYLVGVSCTSNLNW